MKMNPCSQTIRHEITSQISDDMHHITEDATKFGVDSDQNAFIEDCIRLREREVRYARMAKLADEAMADPLFVAEMHAITDEFSGIDIENWPAFITNERRICKNRSTVMPATKTAPADLTKSTSVD